MKVREGEEHHHHRETHLHRDKRALEGEGLHREFIEHHHAYRTEAETPHGEYKLELCDLPTRRHCGQKLHSKLVRRETKFDKQRLEPKWLLMTPNQFTRPHNKHHRFKQQCRMNCRPHFVSCES